MSPVVDQCCSYWATAATLLLVLCHLSLITTVAVGARLVGHSRSSTDPSRHPAAGRPPASDLAISRDRRDSPPLLGNTVNCSSLVGCTCSVDLVIRCRGDAVPRLPPEVDAIFAELNMVGAQLRQLLPVDFVGLRVRRVVLTGNQLHEPLPDYVFAQLADHLTSLVLGACALRILPARLLGDLRRLRALHLWSNHIDVIPDRFFVANSELRELSMWDNHLQTLSNRTLIGLSRLRLLDLDRNSLTAVEHGALIHVKDSLEVLRLSHNSIGALSDTTFSDMHRLRILTLDSNRLSFIDSRTFTDLVGLQTLCLADNHIQFVADGAFKHLQQLRTLDLSNNRLQRVWAGTFVGLNQLLSVDLSRNRLSRLPEATFGQSPTLRRLTVNDNWLTTLDRCTVSSRTRLRAISVIGNIVQCDCRTVWLSHLDARSTSVLGRCVPTDDRAKYDPVLPVHKPSSYVTHHCSVDSRQLCLL